MPRKPHYEAFVIIRDEMLALENDRDRDSPRSSVRRPVPGAPLVEFRQTRGSIAALSNEDFKRIIG